MERNKYPATHRMSTGILLHPWFGLGRTMIFFGKGVWGALEESEPESELEFSEVEPPSCFLLAFVGGEVSELVSESEDESLSELLEPEDKDDEDELDSSSFRFFLSWLNGWPKRGASTPSFSHEHYNE